MPDLNLLCLSSIATRAWKRTKKEELINELYPAERKYLNMMDKSNPPKSIHICGGQFANRQLANWSNLVFYQGFIYPKASFYGKDIIALKFLTSSPKNCRIYLILLGEKPCKTDKSPLQSPDKFFDGFSSFRHSQKHKGWYKSIITWKSNSHSWFADAFIFTPSTG